MCVLLSADFNGDFEKNVEAEILRRIEALPPGGFDPMLKRMMRFAQGRRPWLGWYRDNFDRLNDPEVRFSAWQDEGGQIHVADNLLITMRKVLSHEEHTRTRYQFSGPTGRRAP
ncbi:hypothetical protein [uncultured Shimia sp.]|uniref:hypothetical protein n=1 Tax=uncultured Shimia sp. TaxID=573152 RepID=UPI002620A69B|nr:hypothetical protein [uncultured Shimia sp.]